MAFQKAVKRRSKLRLALAGTTGSGKTYSALVLAQAIGGRVAVIDSERGSASLYADRFEFDCDDLSQHSVDTYVNAVRAAAAARYDVLVIDSLSHEWMGKGGVLEEVDRSAAASRAGSKFNAWNGPSQKHTSLIDEILAFPGHVICTMRKKMEYVLEAGPNGKQAPKRVGMAPVQRDGVEYEFTCVFDLEPDGVVGISKHRTGALLEERRTTLRREQLGDVGKLLVEWLNTGPAPASASAPVTQFPKPALVPAAPAPSTPTNAADMTAALKASIEQAKGNGAPPLEEQISIAIGEAQSEANLNALVPRLQALGAKHPKYASLRLAWGARRDALKRAATP